MKKTKMKIYALLTAFMVVCTSFVSSGCAKEKQTEEAAPPAPQQQVQDIVLENYGLNVQVQNKHRLVVTETLTVNYEKKIEGITRVIPFEGYRFDSEKNEVVQYRMVLDQVDIDADYTLEKEAGKAYLTIGATDTANAGGTQIYTLKYRLSYYQDQDVTKDQLYFDLLPYDWEGKITSANINITMPKDYETTGITLYRYSGGSWMESKAAYTASGKNISAHLKEEDIHANPDLSMLIKLPEGYFKGEKTLLPLQIFFYILVVLMTLGILVLWWIFGKPSKTVKAELVKKHKLSVLEDAYLLRGTVTVTDVAAFLTSWAESGIVRIIQLSTKEYSITCLEKPDKSAKNFEFTLYDTLCKGGVQTHTTAAAAARIRKALPKLKRQVARNCAAICGGRLYTLESICVKAASLLFSVLPIVITLAVGGHLVLDYSAGYVGVIAACTLLLIHIGILALIDKWKNIRKLFRLILTAIAAILELMVLGGVLYYAGNTLHMTSQSIMAVAASAAMLAAAIFSGRKSVGYQNQLAQLMAYKRYLKNPSLDEVDVTDFYYEKLPQAYVMRIGKLFSKKCDDQPLYAHDGLVLRGDAEKLSHAAGFYPAYQHFISTLYLAEPPAPVKKEEKSETSAPKESNEPKQEQTEKAQKEPKLSGIGGVFTLVFSSVVAVFQKIAVWINEVIDWFEVKFDSLKRKASRKSDEEEAETESEENED